MRPALAALLLASACGPADFSGHFKGRFNVTGTCADGRTLEHAYDADWTITQKADRLAIATNGSCGTWTATVLGDFARVDSKDCDEAGGGGFVFWPSLAQAEISVEDGGVHALGGFHDKATTPELDGGTTTCTTLLEADLQRQ